MSRKGDKARKDQRALERRQSANPTGPMRPGGVTAIGLSYRSGPLPSPKDLAEYNAIVPGLAETLVTTFTRQTNHRIEIESTVVRGNDKRATRAQIMAYTLALAAIAGGVYLAAQGKSTEGLATIITAVTGLVATFVTGKIFQERERKEKRTGQ